MLIVSKFHDYYDPVVKTTGVDKSIVYERFTSSDEFDLISRWVYRYRSPHRELTLLDKVWHDTYSFALFRRQPIFFCGKMYIIYELDPEPRRGIHDSFFCKACRELKSGQKVLAFQWADFVRIIKDHKILNYKSFYDAGDEKKFVANQNFRVNEDEILKLHQECNSPVFMIEPTGCMECSAERKKQRRLQQILEQKKALERGRRRGWDNCRC